MNVLKYIKWHLFKARVQRFKKSKINVRITTCYILFKLFKHNLQDLNNKYSNPGTKN